MSDDGRAMWPDLHVDPDVVSRRVEELSTDGRDDRGELYIAIAIEAKVPGAVEAFERHYFTSLAPALAARGASRHEIDEITQQVRLRLLAPREDGTTTLSRYAGRGQLEGLVRVTAIRAFLNLRESQAREADPEDWLGDLVAPDLDAPGQVLAAEERHDVKQALAAALAALEPRERALLRMHFVNGLGIDPIAKMLGVHRATAARQLAKLKESVVDRVRLALAKRWGESEVLTRIASRVDLSLERLLATSEDP